MSLEHPPDYLFIRDQSAIPARCCKRFHRDRLIQPGISYNTFGVEFTAGERLSEEYAGPHANRGQGPANVRYRDTLTAILSSLDPSGSLYSGVAKLRSAAHEKSARYSFLYFTVNL